MTRIVSNPGVPVSMWSQAPGIKRVSIPARVIESAFQVWNLCDVLDDAVETSGRLVVVHPGFNVVLAGRFLAHVCLFRPSHLSLFWPSQAVSGAGARRGRQSSLTGRIRLNRQQRRWGREAG